MLQRGIQNVRRLATNAIHSSPAPAESSPIHNTTRGIWELVFIGATGSFGLYEIYKGMFMMPQREPTQEEIKWRLEKQKEQSRHAEWEKTLLNKVSQHPEEQAQPVVTKVTSHSAAPSSSEDTSERYTTHPH